MAKQQTEEELNIKRKARRRLVGAIALTLAVVVILPMMLESEPRQTSQDIDLRIPAPDKVGEFVPGVVVPAMPEAPEPEAPVAVAPDAGAASAVVPAAEVKPAAPPVTSEPAAKPQEAAKQDKPALAEAFIVQVGAYSNADTAKQELAKLKEWGFRAAYLEKAGDKTRVRVGPYAEREKADKVRGMLEKHGLHPVVMGSQ
ncbi:MAG: hypothetical protein A2Z95_06585 [Gallionellales bacterium GWA2_60_18]|nr:MAG: hypothetical protein A2Z95_06585 [Gallionellales bacterium GWA2_60_18]